MTDPLSDTMAALTAGVERLERMRAEALRSAVYFEHELPPVLAMVPPPGLDFDSPHRGHTPETADLANEQARLVEQAAVARVLRVAVQFAEFIKTGLDEEGRAQVNLVLGEHPGLGELGDW
jgi:hypothetical protein